MRERYWPIPPFSFGICGCGRCALDLIARDEEIAHDQYVHLRSQEAIQRLLGSAHDGLGLVDNETPGGWLKFEAAEICKLVLRFANQLRCDVEVA